MLKYLFLVELFLLTSFAVHAGQPSNYYVGLSMDFVPYLEKKGIVYKDNGKPKDPFESIKDHGANIVRLTVMFPPFETEHSKGQPPVDWGSFENVTENIRRAKKYGLNVFLTFTYKGFGEHKIHNTAPKEWAHISDANVLEKKVYQYTYEKLKFLGKENLLPEFVSIGNEINTDFLAPVQKQDYALDAKRNALLINAGLQAVKDISKTYDKDIKTAMHLFAPEHIKWWVEQHWPAGLKNFDVIAVSYYYGWHKMGQWESFEQLIGWLKTEYNKEFIILETSSPWTNKTSDKRINIFGNVPPGYPNPPTKAGQKKYLTDLTREVIAAGGLGVIYWGGEWVGSDIYVFPDKYGKGSSWENNTFWDFDNNLHEGIDWMMEDYSRLNK